MIPFQLRPLGLVIQPDFNNPYEIEGILNPAAARGPDGELYLFPRMVGAGNFSRIGIVRVLFDKAGEPRDVERLGIVLEPEMPYELQPNGRGGCEDPRVTFVEPLQRYVMSYTALSLNGPRIALAVSKDLFSWHRLGLASFTPYEGIDFDGIKDKDAASFPLAIPNPSGVLELGILHRPLFPGTLPEDNVTGDESLKGDVHRQSIWISYSSLALADTDPRQLAHFTSHHRLAVPVSPWEKLKIGSGTPPVMTRHGWMIVYHGVSNVVQPNSEERRLTYSAGVMVLSKEHPQDVLYRSTEPVLTPMSSEKRRETLANVVFPTGIDRRLDIDRPHRYDVYYGINDLCIGVARLDVPSEILRQPSPLSPKVKG